MEPQTRSRPSPTATRERTLHRVIRKWRNTLVFILLGLAGATVVLEAGLRIFGAHRPVLYQADPVLGYRLKPNQHVSFFGNEITINHLGIRDARTFDAKAPDTTRILVLGDSVTWGGVRLPQHELFTSILEHELGDAEVINAGVNGYSVWRMAALYREHLQVLKPDIVIVYVIPGDFYRPAVVDLVRTSPAFPLKNPTFALAAAMSSARIVLASQLHWDWLRPRGPGEPRSSLTDEEHVDLNVEAIIRLNEELSSTQRLVVAVSPFPDHPANPTLPETVTQILEETGIDLIVLRSESLRTEDNFIDHIHLSTQGHAQSGRSLAEHLRESRSGDK